MAAEMLWKFGIYNNGNFTAGANAHWFIDDYWVESGYNGNRPCIAVTNDTSSPRILKSFQFSLINGSSNGHSFTSSSGHSYATSASIATITANIGSVSSNSVQVDSANGHFHYNSSPGQSYWGSRPTNASGTVDKPDAATDGEPIFYTFDFNTGISIPATGTVYILFKATWNTAGTHLIQIYPTKGIVIPVYHSVTWKPNGGNWAGSTANIVQDVEDGKSATKPADPTRIDYTFTGWNPDDTAYKNVTSDLTYTAQWELSTAKVDFYRNFDASDTQHNIGTGQIGSRVGSGEDTISSRITNDSGTYSTLKEQVEANIRQDVAAGGRCSGYTFWHWRRSKDIHTISSNPSILPAYVNLNAVNINSDAIQNKFYAVWQAKSGKVTFYRNYSDSDMEVVDGGEISDVDYVTSTLGSTKPVNPTRPNMYRFKGWSLSRHGNLEQDSKLLWDTTQGKAIDIFYAIWEKIYTVWVRENGVWIKKLNIRRYNATTKTWDEMAPKQRTNDSWDDKL